jgi:hypothetical protein
MIVLAPAAVDVPAWSNTRTFRDAVKRPNIATYTNIWRSRK